MKKLVIIGASGHGKVVADIARNNGYIEIVFLDDNEELSRCGGHPVEGKTSEFKNYNCDIIVAIGNAKIRERFQQQINPDQLPVLIHSNAYLAENVEIGKGTVVVAGAVINPGAKIGAGCIINTGSSVDHDCVISDFVHISVGVHVAGMVKIGNRTWIGAGATVNNNLNICGDCMVGAGAVVIKDIKEPGTYIGVPVKEKNMLKNKREGVKLNSFTLRQKRNEVAA